MAAVPDRKTLESMKRIDLQKLCKDYGLRANLKSEALVDLLLSATGPPKPSQIPQAKRPSSLRVVSRATSVASRPRGTSSSSVIIHDTDDEYGGQEVAPPGSIAVAGPSQPRVPASGPIRSPRKAKATQYRLGVGRPTIAGGRGARAVTRSLSVPKSKSGKVSRSGKPAEEAIQEEEEPEPPGTSDAPEAGSSGAPHDDSLAVVPSQPLVPPTARSDMTEGLQTYLMNLVNPLRQQVSELQTEVQHANSRLAAVGSIEARLSELSSEVNILKGQASRSEQLETEISMLRDYMSTLKLGTTHSRSETAASGGSRLTEQTAVSPSHAGPSNINNHFAHQELPATLLGKRNRGSKDSDLAEVAEADREFQPGRAVLATQVIRPVKKRAKLGLLGESTVSPAAEEEEEEMNVPPRPPAPTFTIFTGPEEPPEEVEPPQATSRSAGRSGTPESHVITSTANASENQPVGNPFTFNFGEAITSTPATTTFDANAFTFPSLPPSIPVPTSPTPGGDPGPSSLYDQRPGGRRPRTGSEMYGSLGRGPNNRPRGAVAGPSRAPPSSSAMPGPSSQTIRDPLAEYMSTADLIRPRTPVEGLSMIPEDSMDNTMPPRPRISSIMTSDVGVMPPETPAPPMKRTMYGTEVEQDTRFGDFGMEGVAMGFWTGAAHF